MERSGQDVKNSRRAVEKPGSDVASKWADLKPQTSCCYKTMNHLHTAVDLRQCLLGKLREVLFLREIQVSVQVQ